MRISAPLLLGSLISPAVSAQRAIQLDVQAEWPVHVGDTAAQVAEFVADFSPELFWPFVQSCCAAGGGAGCDEGAAAAAEALLPAGTQHLLETSVGLGTYAPAVRFFASLAEDYGNPCGGEAFAVAFPGDAVHCRGSSSGAAGAVSFAFEQTGRLDVSGDSPAPWDHNYPGPAAETDAETEVRRHVVLYGVIGTPSFCAWHEELAAGAAGGAFRYSARPAAAGAPAIAAARALQGYGVHLDIKNMEYRNLDDSSAQGGDSAAAAQDSPFPSQEVKGINFRKLHERHPDLEAGLVRAHEELVRLEQDEIRRGAVSSSADSMKAWKVADLGYQTVLSIATSDDPAWRMEQLLHNFPSQANSLSNLKVSPEAKQVLSDLHTNGVANTLPFNSILVNGVAMDISAATFGAYDLLESIKEEYRRQSELSGFRLGPRALAAVKAAAARVSSSLASPGGSQAQGAPPDMRSVVRVDVSRGGKNVVQFVNNLEKDAMYMNNAYSRSVKTLMQPSWSLHMIAKNLYTLVAVVDITTPNGRSLLGSLQGIYERQYPIRLGVVFATSEADDLSLANRNEDMPATASDILRVFEHVKGAVDLAAALELAFAVSGRMEEAFEHSGARAAYTLSPDGSLVKNPAHAGRPAVLLTRQQLVRQTAQFLQSHGVPAGEDGLYAVLMGAGEPLSADGPGLVQETREYLSQRGLPPDSFSFNGVVVESADVEGQLMALLGREQYFLGLMVQRGQISDRTRSIFNHVLKHSKVHNRYHSILNEQRPLYASPLKSPLMLLAESSAYLRHPSTPARCSDRAAAVSSAAANTVMLLFPLTQPGVQSAAAAVEWVWARNTTADPRGARLALVPLLPDGATETEVALAYALHRLVELVGATEGERDRLQALRWVPAFLRVMEAARGGSLKAASQAFLDAAREAAEPMSGELTAVLDTYVEGELGGEAQLSDMLRRQAWALSVIDSVEAAALEAAEDAAETPSGDACGTGNAKACNKNTYVLLNGRVMRAQRAPLHALDLEMLGQMAAEGVSEPLLASLGGAGGEAVAVTVADLLPADSAVPDGAPLQSAVDDLFLSMAAFCGSSAVGGPVRVDVKEMLASLGLYRKSVSGVAKYFPHLSGDPAAYVAPAELFSVQLAPPRAAEGGADDAVAITVVVNPLTQAGQRAAAMVRLCLDHLQLPVHLVLIPPFDVPEFPIKNYYRFVASPVVAAAGAPSAAAVASFRQMPRAQIFTVRMDVPEAWNVQATHSPQDIDNLVCDARSCGDAPASDTSYVTYTLKNLLVAGQCYEQGGDARSATPPNGLQLTLDAVRKNNAHLFPQNTTGALGAVRDSRVHSDTLVMQNLGYFQLQADAGMYFLRLAEGKARALYSMESEGLLFGPAGGDIGEEEGDEAEEDEDDESEEEEDGMAAALRAATGGPSVGIPVPVMSFGEAVLQLKVRKRAGMEHVPLLEDPDRKPSRSIRHKRKGEAVSEEDGGVVDSVWSSLSSMFGGAQPAAPASNETIHVFSLATGHVYERLLRIMMLSVSKRTKSPLKFWLFENYLSPTFKLLAGEMARKYGFEIGYVTYKWPKWLTEQTNKQRIIWGYKILFLDVLFPLNVKKVIYVDADQTVRADLKELWDMDLNGKPYGYVPFCSSRKETLGYQFWRSGYWENHLAGKPYHISALYVVDLTVFRRYAVGDRLRAVYDQLARDPNSLANLDQDLPNFAQHTVPIHSLPQEWLWCETWCSDKSKSKAKTIDLCNNPDKKEPKLDMARRIISGSLFKESWVELDDEVRALGVDSGITVRAD